MLPIPKYPKKIWSGEKTKRRESKIGHLIFKRPSSKWKRQDKVYTNTEISTDIDKSNESIGTSRKNGWKSIESTLMLAQLPKQNKRETKMKWMTLSHYLAISKYTLVIFCRLVFLFFFIACSVSRSIVFLRASFPFWCDMKIWIVKPIGVRNKR